MLPLPTHHWRLSPCSPLQHLFQAGNALCGTLRPQPLPALTPAPTAPACARCEALLQKL